MTGWPWSRRWPGRSTSSPPSTPRATRRSKRLPFEEAASGAVGLETLLPAAMRLYHAGHIGLPALFRAISLNPANLLGLPPGRLTAARQPIWCSSTPTALRARPLHPALEVEEHPLRRRADAGQGPARPGSRGTKSLQRRLTCPTSPRPAILHPDRRGAVLSARLDPLRPRHHPRAGARRPARRSAPATSARPMSCAPETRARPPRP